MHVGFQHKSCLIIRCMLYVQRLFVPKTMIKCLIFSRTANHTGMMMPLSQWGTLAKKPQSFPLIYISLHQHQPLTLQKKKKQGSLLLLLCNCKSPNILSLHIPLVAFLPPLLLHNLVGIMWQGWIFWVTAVWLPLLTRDKGSGKNFTAFYLLLINSQLLCLPVFYVLSRNLYFATLQPLLLSRLTKISRMLPHCIIVK